MDSKEATSHPIPEASSGAPAYTSSAYISENDTLLSKTVASDDNSKNDSKGIVSEDEGYASGKEEFETAPDKAVLDETLGEAIGEGNSDAPFVDASAKIESLPSSGVVVNDDNVEKGNRDGEGRKEVGGDEVGVGKDLAADAGKEVKFSGVEGLDGKGEILDSVEKLGVSSNEGVVQSGEVINGNEGKAVVEGVGKSESLTAGHEVSEAEVKDRCEAAVVEPVESKLTPEGGTVVDTIQADVAGPGVAVIGDSEEKGVVVKYPEEKEAVDVAVVKSEKPEVVRSGGVTPMPEGDLVVNTSQVDVVETRETVAPKMGENETLSTELESKEDDVRLMPEEDSVVDTIQVDKVGPGVAFVGKTRENGGGEIEGVEVPLVKIGDATESGDGINEEVIPEKTEEKETLAIELESKGVAETVPEGDSVVDAIQVDKVGPGVAVVGKMDENGGGKIEGVEVPLVKIANSTESGDGVNEEVITKEVDGNGTLDAENSIKKPEAETIENGIASKTHTDGEVAPVSEIVSSDRDFGAVETSGEHAVAREESKWAALAEPHPEEIKEVENEMDEDSDGETDGMIFGSSEAARKFIEDLERESGGDSHTGAGSSLDQSQNIDGQIVTDSEEEGDTDDEGGGKELFDSAALAALLKAATGADPDGGNITITSQDGSRLFSVERPAGLGSSLRSLRPAPRPNRPYIFGPSAPAGGGESEDNLSEEEKKKLEKLQQVRVKFLRLVHRLGLSPEESVAAQVLYRLALLGGRQSTQTFNLEAAKATALQLEAEERDNLGFSINVLVLGKSGVGKSATINSIFGEEKAEIDAFQTGTAYVKEISGFVDGVKVHVIDTPGLKSSSMEQGFNRGVLSSVKKLIKKSPPDVILYVDRLDAQSRDLNDLPLLKTVTAALGQSIWRNAVVTLTHAASAPPDGPSGAPLSYEVFVSQRSHVVQQSIGHAVGDLRMMSPSLMNPVSLVENHPSCRKNREGQKILPNGQSWRPQLLLLCYSMKILAEASSLSKPQDPFDHRKLFGFRARSPPLPYMLSSMLQSRTHPKLPSDQGGESVDSDIDLDDLSDSDEEEEDEYDQLPPFKPLRKAQLERLSKEQRKAYLEEYDYRVKLLQKKQWREELRRMKEAKRKGKDGSSPTTDIGFPEEEPDPASAAPVAVPLPDMTLPPSFDADNPAYRYRFLEPTSQFLARPVLDSHGWDHDCGYDGVNLEHSLAIANRFPLAYTVQITKDKKDFTISLDSSVAAKLGEDTSALAGFDIQSMGKQLAYVLRAETKTKRFKKNKAAGGVSFTFLGENVIPGVKVEDQITLNKRYVLVGSAGAVRSQTDTAYGANFELQRRELDYPIGQVQSTFSMSIIKWRGDLALGFNSLAQFTIGRNSKVAVRAGINNKLSGQVTVKTSSSDHLSLALAAVIPTALSIYRKLYPGAAEKYSIY